jgi:hypothetical protein
MDGLLPFLILILVLGASVGIAIGMSAIMSSWERSIPKPGISHFLDISKSLAPGLVPSKVYVLESSSTTFARSWSIRDVIAESVIASVEYEMNGDIILKMTSGDRYFLENTEPPHRVCTLRASMTGGIGAPLLVRRSGALRNADATYQHPYTHTEIATTPKLHPWFPKKLVMVHPHDSRALASIAWLGAITAGPFYMAIVDELHDTHGDAGCCAILIFESRRFV